MMKKSFFVLTFGLAMICTLGCGGSTTNSVVPAPAENVETTMPGVDVNSAEYQKSMSAQ